MLEKVKEYALEKYAGDQDLADQFVEGFVKQAFNVQELNKGLGNGLGNAIGKGLGGMALGVGVNAIAGAMKNVETSSLHTKFLEALERAISSNRVLREAEPERVKQYAQTIFRFAPHVAGDSNLLSSILANAIHGEGIDPMTVRTLSDLEGRFVDNKTSNMFSPKTYV